MSTITSDERGFIIPCPTCRQKNRVTFATKEARCGKCKAVLPAVSEPVDVPSAAVLDALIRAYPLPMVVDFWAPWCGPCRMVAPELVRVATAHAGRFLVVKVDTDSVPELGDRFSIRSIPTMAVFQGGREIGRRAGAMPAAQIEAFVDGALAAV